MATRLFFVVNHAGFFLSHRLPIALAAREAGYEVHIATPQSRHVPIIRQHGLPWHEINLTRSGRNPLGELAALRSIERLYREQRPDIVHQVTTKPVIYGTIAARRAGVPAVVNAIAGLGHMFTSGSAAAALRVVAGFGFRFALRHPNMRVIFQNEENRDLFLTSRWLTPQQVVLIPGSGADLSTFVPAPGERLSPPLVILPSRLIYAKGIVEFVEAARLLRERGVAARFALVGEPDPDNPGSVEVQQLNEWAEAGLVEYWGRRADMPAVYAQASIVALPTRYAEGVPKTLIEAAAAGLPSVTTDSPGCRDIVLHERTGLLIPPGDATALADALGTLIEQPELRQRFGVEARRHAESRFGVERVIDATLATYRELQRA